MVTLLIGEITIKLTSKNELAVKELLREKFPLDTIVTIVESGVKLRIDDIFNYEN